MAPVKVILNPAAGRGYAAQAEPALRRYLQEEGVTFELVRTAVPRHAIQLAQQAIDEGYEVVVAAGGDGTTNEVTNGVMAAAAKGKSGAMGVIPLGSGSDFAHAIGVPTSLRAACRHLAQGQPRSVDVGRITVDGRQSYYFANTAGIGFDAVVTVETQKVKWLRGLALYLPVVLKTIFLNSASTQMTIVYDEKELALPALMVCVANGPREGGAFHIAPQTQLDDGRFDVCIAGHMSRLAILGILPHFMKGTHVDRDPIQMVRTTQITVSSTENLVAHMDGEVLCTDGHQIGCTILPGQLCVWC